MAWTAKTPANEPLIVCFTGPQTTLFYDFKIGIHSFPAWRSALKEQCEEQAGKFTCCAVGKALSGITPSWRGRQMAGNS